MNLDNNDVLKKLQLEQNRNRNYSCQFCLSILKHIRGLYCDQGKKFIDHLINYYFFNSFNKNQPIIKIQINFTNPNIQSCSGLLIHILEFNQRLLPLKKYNVKISNYLQDQIKGPDISNDISKSIDDIKSKLERGESIKEHYSKKLFNAFAKKKKFVDIFLQYLSIRHLHFTKEDRKNEILVYCKNGNDILIMGIFNHDLFTKGEGLSDIISILKSDFPEFIQEKKLIGVDEVDLSSDDIFTLAQRRCYAPPLVGNILELVMQADILEDQINTLCDSIIEKLGVIPYYYHFTDNMQLICQLERNKAYCVLCELDNDLNDILSNICDKLICFY